MKRDELPDDIYACVCELENLLTSWDKKRIPHGSQVSALLNMYGITCVLSGINKLQFMKISGDCFDMHKEENERLDEKG